MQDVLIGHIQELEAARRGAMLNNDIGRLDDLLDPELEWVHASAKVDSKSSFLEGLRTGRLRCFGLDFSDQRVHAFPAAAFVTGVVRMDVEVDGQKRQSTNRFTCIWLKRSAKFLQVRWQSTRIPHDAAS